MAELLDILDAFTMPLKIAWVVWFAWGIAQVFWYRYERKPQTAGRRAPAKKPFVSKPSVPDRAPARLVTPEQVISSAPPIVESPGESFLPLAEGTREVTELDRFVADFEMNTRQRRGHPHNEDPALDSNPQHST